VHKKEFVTDAWPEVYASRQKKTILRWPVKAVEEHVLRVRGENNETREEKILCLAVMKDNVKGVIPLPETGVKPGRNRTLTRARLSGLLGQDIAFVVTGIDEANETFIASRKQALERLAAETWPTLEEGAVKTAVARRVLRIARSRDGSVVPAGCVVEIDGVEAFLPVREISHGWVDEILEVIQPGDMFDVKVLSVDRERERVIVSVKALLPNPWPGAARRYLKKSSYTGTVTGVTRYGVFVELEPGVNALCNHMASGRPQKGDEVAIYITSVEPNGESGRIKGSVIRIVRKAS